MGAAGKDIETYNELPPGRTRVPPLQPRSLPDLGFVIELDLDKPKTLERRSIGMGLVCGRN